MGTHRAGISTSSLFLTILIVSCFSCHGRQLHKESRRDPTSAIHHYGQDIPHLRHKRSPPVIDDDLLSMCTSLGYFMEKETCLVPELTRYHSADGSCNNLNDPSRGKAGMPHRRFLPPDYGDGRGSLREAAEGRTLPSTRLVTTTVTEEGSVLIPMMTAMTMHFGQLLDHDVGHTPVEADKCDCTPSANCIPIPVPANDPAFHSRCIPLSRSKTVPGPGCVAEPREQVNQITTFIDGSMLYGSSAEMQAELRGEKGLLRTSPNPFDASLLPFLPVDEENAQCNGADLEFPCGKAGDKRAAVQPGLSALHTSFLRYHNHVATELAKINQFWDSDRIFHEARKIVSSILQHITYNEYLPINLGSVLMEKYQLSVGKNEQYRGYQEDVDATMPNVFAHAAFRLGHSQIASHLTRVDVNYEEVYSPVDLKLAYFNGSAMHDVANGGMDSLLRGMIVQPLDKVDRFFSEDVTRFLFADPKESFGLDLVAINTQRGRDHGLPGYTKWREYCGLKNVSSFDDLADDMTDETISRLRMAYTHVDDVDAFIGMVIEEPVMGCLVGPTAASILGKHFHDLRFGDRFWYENAAGAQALTKGQRNAIRKMTLARVMCDTMDEIQTIQPFVFHEAQENRGGYTSFADYSSTHTYPDGYGGLPGFSNVRAKCDDLNAIPTLDLGLWHEGHYKTKCGTDI